MLISHHTTAHKHTYQVKMRPRATSSLLSLCTLNRHAGPEQSTYPLCGLPFSIGNPTIVPSLSLYPSAVFPGEITALYLTLLLTDMEKSTKDGNTPSQVCTC